MLNALKFVQGSIAKKDFVPALTHFAIENGRVRGYNGMIALCSPLPFDISCNPKADPLIKAIGNSEETIQLSMTPAGRLSIKSGKFKAFVDCVEGDTPHVEPEGDRIDFNGEAFLTAIKILAPYIGDDASRPWSNGVLLRGHSGFATNNIIIMEYWIGSQFPECNIPRAAIKEMLRINEAPVGVQLAGNSITFHYPNERWLRTQLFSLEWPDIGKVLDRESAPVPIPELLFAGLAVVKPFCNKMGAILFGPTGIRTHEEETEGASYDVEGLFNDGIYNIEMLASLEGNVKAIDFSTYPSPALFTGDRLRGAIVGIRK